MSVCHGRGAWSGGLALLAFGLPAHAADPNRMLLLAAEAASATHGSATVHGVAWWWLAIVVGTAMCSAFAGAYFGLRRFSIDHIRADGDWREVTYRFRAKGPVKYGSAMVEILHRVVGELEQHAPQRRGRRGAARPAPPSPELVASVPAPRATEPVAPAPERRVSRPATPRTSPAPASGAGTPAASPQAAPPTERAQAYQQARRLLAEGHDSWTVHELTGLKFAELDLLTSAAGEVPPARPVEAKR